MKLLNNYSTPWLLITHLKPKASVMRTDEYSQRCTRKPFRLLFSDLQQLANINHLEQGIKGPEKKGSEEWKGKFLN